MRDSSASSRDASLTSLIRRSSRVTSCAMIVSNWRLPFRVLDAPQCLDRAADRRQRVLDLVRHVGGETSRSRPCARTAPARNSASAVASAPTSSRRCSSGAGTLPARPWPSRMSAAAPARRRIGRAMVSDRYQDSSTVSAQRQAEQRQDRDAHDEQAAVHLARVARQQDDADGVVIALDRLRHGDQQLVVLGAPDIGRRLAALAGAVEASAPPSRPAAIPIRRPPASCRRSAGSAFRAAAAP